ncbi:MAG: TlpA family protein disulfide reductase, partial [Actinomycetota bacterium]|nr:TlpA family protein disulfide reductase [Actinomycetota bacterium]
PTPAGEPSRRHRIVRPLVIATVIAVLVGAAAYALRPTTDPREEGGVAELATPFPGLRGEAVVGTPVDTDAMRWSVLVVNVWATWCEPCRREQPALQRVQAEYGDEGVEFVGVDYRDDRAAAERWIDDFAVTYPSLYDPDGRTAASLGFPFLPDTYLVDDAGTMRYAIYGETSAEELSQLIDEVLAEPDVAAS